jgi:hypothetical protein
MAASLFYADHFCEEIYSWNRIQNSKIVLAESHTVE